MSPEEDTRWRLSRKRREYYPPLGTWYAEWRAAQEAAGWGRYDDLHMEVQQAGCLRPTGFLLDMVSDGVVVWAERPRWISENANHWAEPMVKVTDKARWDWELAKMRAVAQCREFMDGT